MPFGYGERRAGGRRKAPAIIVPAPVFAVQPAIGGVPRVGQTASASNGSIVNGAVSARRWLLNGSAISGATGGSYVPVGSDAGGTLVYEVTATGAGGTTIASAPGQTVLPMAPANSVTPALSGTAREGQILSSSSGTWTGSPTSFAYQWNRDGAPISGSINATRTLTTADVGHVVSCTVTATNAGGSTPATSANSTSVIAAATPVPVNTVAPTVTGSTTRASALSSTTGTWSNSPTGFAYQWRLDGVDIAGATASTYTIAFGDVGRSLTCRVFAANAGGTAGATSNTVAATSSLSSIDTKGWSGQWGVSGTLPTYSTGAREFSPDTTPDYLPLTRQGYDATGTAIAISERLAVMRRVRQAWTGTSPGTGNGTHLLANGNTVSLSGYVFSTDTTPAGVTNNSTETSPLPVAQWEQRNRRVVGNSLYVEVVAFHGSGAAGKPVAAVTATATDGTTTTVPLVLTGPAILPSTTDKAAVIGYYGTIDVSALADGVVTANASVYPRIGGSASVLSSSGTADARGFTPQVHYKAATSTAPFKSKGINPVYASVDLSTGVDATVDVNGQIAGVSKLSTTAATAKASPFATIAGALNAIRLATNVTGGFTDGCIIRLGTGAHAITSPAAGTYQSGGEVVIEAEPSVAASGVSISLTANTTWRQTWYTLRNVGITRTATSQLQQNGTGRVALENCRLDSTSSSTIFWSGTLWVNGLTITGGTPSFSGSGIVNCLRGLVAGTPNSGTTYGGIDAYNLVGCQLGNPVLFTSGVVLSGGVAAYNSILGCTGQAFGIGTTTVGYAWVQNVLVFTGTISTRSMSLSPDGNANNLTHLIEWNNTYAGASVAGRHNELYDETLGTLRSHKQCSQIGNIYVQTYTKHDWYIGGQAVAGTSGDATRAEAPSHVNGWSGLYQVGARGNFHQFTVDTGSGPGGGPNGDRNPADFGLSAKYSVAASYGRLDPLFVGASTKYTTVTTGGTFTAGDATGVATDFALQSGSPAKGIVPSAVLPFDFGGNVRSASADTAGAWA